MAAILIAGCGDVGTALGLTLVQAGHQVWALRRNSTVLPAVLQPIAADLSQAEDLNKLPAALDYVFYTASAGGFSEPLYRAAYVTGVENLLQALHHQGQHISRFFLVSSTSVYGQTDGSWVDENSVADAQGFSGRCLRAGEQLLWDDSYPGTVVRFGGIYGPGRTRMIDGVRNGSLTYRDGVYSNRIHRDDCANVLQHLMQLSAPEQLYLGIDDHPVLQSEVMIWLAGQLDVPPPQPNNTPQSTRPLSNKRCSNKRLRDSGLQLLYPGYKQGYTDLLTTIT